MNLSGYQHVVYAFPSVSSCGWSGLAYMPGRQSWLNNAGSTSLRTIAHELGHNFGTHHAGALNCKDGTVRVPLSANTSNCTVTEYGDPFSVMGSSAKYEPTNYSRGNFGRLQSANTFTVTSAGDYTLKSIAGYDSAAVQALRVKRTSSTFLTIELRENDGSYFDSFAASDPVVNGVSVRLTSDYSTRSVSQLVDMTPATTGFSDSALVPGQTLVDPSRACRSRRSPSPAVARSSVSRLGPTTSDRPPRPGGLSAKAVDTSRVQLSWTASTDAVGVAGYRITRDGSLVATVTGTTYTDSGLSPATAYAYGVAAFDAAGNTSAAAPASATTLAGDTQAPIQPGGVTAKALDASRIQLSWTASTDNVGVAGYRVLRGGVLVATVTGTGWTEHGAHREHDVRLPGGRLRRRRERERRRHGERDDGGGRGHRRAGADAAGEPDRAARQGQEGAALVEPELGQRGRRGLPRLPQRRPGGADGGHGLHRHARRQEPERDVHRRRGRRRRQRQPAVAVGVGRLART